MTIGLGENQTNPEQTVNAMILGVHTRTLLGNTDETLSEAEATNAIVKLSGTLTQDVSVFLPDQDKTYLIKNDTSGAYTITIKNPSGGSGVVLDQGAFMMMYCDATANEIYAAEAVATVPSILANKTLTDPIIADATMNGYGEAATAVAISSGTLTLDLADTNFFTVTLTENISTIVFVNVPSGKVVPLTIEFTQDGTGGHTVNGWPTAVKWSGAATPTITAAANAVDVISGYTRDGGTTIRLDLSMEDSK